MADAQALSAQAGGAQRDGRLRDIEVAARLYQQELHQNRLAFDERRVAQITADTDLTDREPITDGPLREAILLNNPFDLVFIGDEVPAEQGHSDTETQGVDEAYHTEETPQPEAPESEEEKPQPDIPCSNCTDNFFDEGLSTATCGHRYCGDCIRETFTRAFRDEELFPPRCCRQVIPLEAVSAFLTEEIESTFGHKTVEYSTKYRVYCSATGCETFLTPEMTIREGAAQCSTCQAITCTLCKGPSHEGDCPVDEDMRQLEVLAEGEGWTRCPECRRMVDLIQGCYHMSCPCKTQFCYLCAAFPWKACECPQWDEDRLMERAQEVVEIQNRGNRVAGPPALNAVLTVAENIAGRHNCQHTRFVSQRGENQCSMCQDTMPEFIYSCVNCHTLLCRRCRRNRL
ncbi:hypothetical protein BKA64DRAFT_579085 [Cadophora sp. MPI-SDFR-AT-0126]|nr:hypothetical protein BKA64DRAFT_579085 [Leotiomycetes sp. MPI-SDFR-AT-0126]